MLGGFVIRAEPADGLQSGHTLSIHPHSTSPRAATCHVRKKPNCLTHRGFISSVILYHFLGSHGHIDLKPTL